MDKKESRGKILYTIFDGLFNVGTCCYVFATILVAVNTIARYLLKHSIFGIEELSAYVILITAFLLFPCQEARNKHLCVEVFAEKCKNKRLVQIVYVLRGFLTLGLFGVMTYAGVQCVMTANRFGASSPTLHIPKDILFAVVTASYIFAIVMWLLILFWNERRPLE